MEIKFIYSLFLFFLFLYIRLFLPQRIETDASSGSGSGSGASSSRHAFPRTFPAVSRVFASSNLNMESTRGNKQDISQNL